MGQDAEGNWVPDSSDYEQPSGGPETPFETSPIDSMPAAQSPAAQADTLYSNTKWGGGDDQIYNVIMGVRSSYGVADAANSAQSEKIAGGDKGAETSWIGARLKEFSTALGFDKLSQDNQAKLGAAAIPVIGGIIGGVGTGIANSRKLAQERELMQQKLDIERQLAASQAGIAQQQMANQNLSGYGFRKPQASGLIYNPSKISPLKVTA